MLRRRALRVGIRSLQRASCARQSSVGVLTTEEIVIVLVILLQRRSAEGIRGTCATPCAGLLNLGCMALVTMHTARSQPQQPLPRHLAGPMSRCQCRPAR